LLPRLSSGGGTGDIGIGDWGIGLEIRELENWIGDWRLESENPKKSKIQKNHHSIQHHYFNIQYYHSIIPA